jgi:hypothetical protein
MSEVQTTCPQCGGSSFYINTVKGVYYCHRASCGISGRSKNLGFDVPVAGFKPVQFEDRSLEEPPEYFSLSDNAYEYFKNRNVPRWLVDSMPIYETAKGLLFFFPGFEFWQERRWKQHRPPAWKNCGGDGASAGVYYHVQTHSAREIVLVEGIFDALVVGQFTNAACVLSWRLHHKQVEDISDYYSRLIYMPDGDVPLNKATIEFTKMPIGSTFKQLPLGRDPASMGLDISSYLS